MGCEYEGDPDLRLKGVSTDTRKSMKDLLYFAFRGDRFDGHEFVEEAISRGACAAVVEQGTFSIPDGTETHRIFRVESPLKALQELAAAFRREFDLPVVAVTGSNGKTTTKEMIAEVLQQKYRTVKSPGNLNNHIGLPLSICSWDDGVECAVLEMGANHFGEIRRLCEVARPSHGLITNIGKAHLEFFHDQDGVSRAKGELLDGIEEGGQAFLNGDDPYLVQMRDRIEKTTLFGFSSRCDLRAEDVGVDDEGFPMMRLLSKTIRIRLPGQYNLHNALGAAAVGLNLGVEIDSIKRALEAYRSVEKRMQVEHIAGYTVIDDTYNANPTSMQSTLTAFKDMPHLVRRFIVLGDMLELGDDAEAEHGCLGQDIAGMRFDGFYGLGPWMETAVKRAKKHGMRITEHFKSKQTLIDLLKNLLKPGDGLLVKGSRGMRMEEIIDGLRPEETEPGKEDVT